MNNIEFIVGDETSLNNMAKLGAWKPFDERVISFCDELSKELMKNVQTQRYSDLVSLMFWLRKGNIQSIRKRYNDLDCHLGRGLVFHIAPGNMALSFAYSLATGLLTGNTNIIRLPSRNFEQTDIFCNALMQVLPGKENIAERICLIKYPHDKSVTDFISKMCHVRIIWGGDSTVNTIRESPVQPRTSEITFANRISICVIDSDQYLKSYDAKKTAHDFYIDTYLTDQNACSSPRIIYWIGSNIDEAKERFWDALYEEISDYDMAAVTTSDKLLAFCKVASEKECKMTTVKDYRIVRVEIQDVDEIILDNIGNCGYFYECSINTLDEIIKVCKWELQTISYIGVNKVALKSMVLDNGVEGVDRIVPVGKTMDFDFYWDGKDIIREMTRRISVI